MGKTYKIACIPGDGIGIEVIAASIKVLAVLQPLFDFKFEYTDLPWSSEYYRKNGRYMPPLPEALATLRKHDAIFFGAVGDPDIPDHISLWELLLPIRQGLQLGSNVRPSKIFKGVKPPLAGCEVGDLDWLILRENCEGEYCGQGGRSHTGTPYALGTELAVFTRFGIERHMRYAFELARQRPRKLLTLVTKSNAMRHGMVLWDETFYDVAKDYPDVKWDKMLVDAVTIRMVLKPKSMDVILCTNLHGDILSDLAAALSGSIGIAPSANVDPERKAPGLFEPVHGAAFDIMGKGIANPIATFWSAAEMLRWLGEAKAADGLMSAIEHVLEHGPITGDLGGKANTEQVTQAVISALKQ
ncbi:putative tartrate dehydrogenase [Calocera viscosa TUFC12733]|uniref:D-malate dehydrogenase (decarboxylating) n=1 Tax=Calocera viscosa (strain TUFC12733) TaxID=1330018 RepID=A0A167J1H3_CALVF|nr:putative tartrate dehydrogenase [Calocera viscosa TUFC12733]